MHAKHPMIAIWDDHETSNNSWKDGAQNHQPETEGDWEPRAPRRASGLLRMDAGARTLDGAGSVFPIFLLGDLLTVAAIETRLMARTRQFEYSEIIPTLQTPEDLERFKTEILWDQTREMLGAAQLDYLDRASAPQSAPVSPGGFSPTRSSWGA